MQDRPTSIELLETIAWFLETEVLDELEGSKRHQTRVAINLCHILMREFDLAQSGDIKESERLGNLLDISSEEGSERLNQILCDRLRQSCDVDFEKRALETLLENVKSKLGIVKPGHDDYNFKSELDR